MITIKKNKHSDKFPSVYVLVISGLCVEVY